MRRQIFLLIILAFLQSTVLPFHLVLVFLLLSAYFSNQKSLLWLAFLLGLLLSHLLNLPLGFLSILYILLIQVMLVVSRFTFASNILVLLPLLFAALSINRIVVSLYLSESFSLFPEVLIELGFALPLYVLLRLLDEKLNIRTSLKI